MGCGNIWIVKGSVEDSLRVGMYRQNNLSREEMLSLVSSVYPISPFTEIFSFSQVVFDFLFDVDIHIMNVLSCFVQGEFVAWGQAS